MGFSKYCCRYRAKVGFWLWHGLGFILRASPSISNRLCLPYPGIALSQHWQGDNSSQRRDCKGFTRPAKELLSNAGTFSVDTSQRIAIEKPRCSKKRTPCGLSLPARPTAVVVAAGNRQGCPNLIGKMAGANPAPFKIGMNIDGEFVASGEPSSAGGGSGRKPRYGRYPQSGDAGRNNDPDSAFCPDAGSRQRYHSYPTKQPFQRQPAPHNHGLWFERV